MKKLLSLCLATSAMLISCTKTAINNPPNKPKDNGIFRLSQITYNGSPLMTFKYSNNQVIESSNTYYKDVFAYKSNGQIDTVVTYHNGDPYCIKRISYGNNNKIATVNCYSNNQLNTSTTYTYDSANRVISILIKSGATKYTYNYSYNSAGNQTHYEELYSFNGQQLWTKTINTTSFDDKPNPFLTLKDFEYFFSNNYQSEYDRLGVPATLSKNNPTQSTGTAASLTDSSTGAITYGLKYDNNGYVSQSDFHSLVQGSLGVTYGFSYIKEQ